MNSELNYLRKHFRKKSKSADFNCKRDDCFDFFITKDNKIPIGLWKELGNFTKSTGIEIKVDSLVTLVSDKLNKQEYNDFVDKLYQNILTDKGDPFYPRDYQYEGAYRALKYEFCCEELATSSGKTSIFFTYLSYLNHINKVNSKTKALLIVPNVSLVTQTKKAFEQYSNGLVNWNIHVVGGSKNGFDPEKFKDCNLLITTYQSLINLIPKCLDKKITNLLMKPIKGDKEDRQKEVTRLKDKLKSARLLDICSLFSTVCVDEAHKSRGDSIGDILESCENTEFKLGLSGTLKIEEEYSDFFRMQERTGPLVMTLGAKFLMENDYSPDIKIKRVFLQYDDYDQVVREYLKIQTDSELRERVKAQFFDAKQFGKRMLDIEKGIIFDSKERLEFLSRLIRKFGKNTLILFSDVKNEYGLRVSEKLKEWNTNTFYIDGGTDNTDRDEYKNIMEDRNDVIIVASWGTFATGIDLKNVHHIVFIESTKAEITIRQAIGRGMRYLKGKNVVVIWDIVDDLHGYSVRHSKKRLEIYKEQKFEVLNPKKVDLNDFKS
jgi:superfamily II DNA or RNA helicase